jgi:hypothetical protein
MSDTSVFPYNPQGPRYPPGAVENLKLFQKFEDFIDYFEPIVERFPAYEKQVLCAAIKEPYVPDLRKNNPYQQR